MSERCDPIEQEPVQTFATEAIVIGSGFGGAVASCRLALAGFEVTILERGRRFAPGDFPSVPNPHELLPDSSRWMFDHDHGLWDVTDLGPLRSVQAAGYGGGSLIYANVHLRPDPAALEGWPAEVRADLFDYYERAAAMLDVQTYPKSYFAITPKSDALRRSAAAMGRSAGYFEPPLAVHFDGGVDAFGNDRRACTRCGACCSGCNAGSKNTLDHNYLLVAERAGATAHTLTEVVRIATNESGKRYSVFARDHLRGGAIVRHDADFVFLCAGAVHSTRLLATSFPNAELPALGRRFFGNADAIAMIYGADQPLHPEIGPTITGAIVFDGRDDPAPDAKRHWFMIQDGGYTKSLEHLFGVMRAPVLGDRNRFLPYGDVPRIASLSSVAKPPDANTDVVGHTSASLSTTLLRGLEDEAFIRKIVPKQIATFAMHWLERLRKSETDIIEKTIKGLPDRYVEAYRARYVADHGPGSDRTLLGRFWLFLARRFACIVRATIGSDRIRHALTDAARDSFERTLGLGDGTRVFTEEMVRHGLGLGRAKRSTVEWDPDNGADPTKRLMLLAMGDDRAFPRQLTMKDGRLTATERGDHSVYATEERLFRDVGASVGGEVRVNPLYAMQRETITVHAQGGCGMGAEPRTSVTTPDGMVHGFPGLYVMDASVFPNPVGVNPSATIAALAERNVERFIEARAVIEKGRRTKPLPLSVPSQEALVTAWAARKVSPLTPPTSVASAPPVNPPIELRFEERMRGFIEPVAVSPAPRTKAPPPGARPTTPAEFERYANAGRANDRSLELILNARIPDVAEFAASPVHEIRLSGTVVYTVAGAPRTFEVDADASSMTVMSRSLGGSVRTMYYRIVAPGLDLRGLKMIRDDAGFDSWEDTTRLFVRAAIDGEQMRGIVRLSMEDFVNGMLPKFEAAGTDDEARLAWAVATFGGFFFSNLQRVYLPMLPDLSTGFGGSR